MAAVPPITKGFQWDLARQVERLDFLLRWLPRYAEWGYQELYLHLEDAVAYPSLPAIARPDAYTWREFNRLVDAATAAGIRVVPIVNLLGHTQYLIKVPELRDLNERRDAADRPLERGQICPLHPRTLEVAGKLLRDLAPCCTAGKVHVGLDESFHLGRCPRCRAEIARRGLAAHFAGHVDRLHGLTQTLGLRLGLWADMLYFLPDAIPLLPRDVTAYDWYYHPFARLPRVELFNFAERDLARPLQKHGIAYYGCPLNGAFRYEPLPVFGERLANIRSWWRRCRDVGAQGLLITSWEANRLALELTTVVDAAAANLWLEPENTEIPAMLARGFERVFGMKDGRAAARAALAADRHPFSGYPRWQTNDRWDTASRREPLTAYQTEQRVFAQAVRHAQAKELPAVFRASLVLRRYLAVRDVFVRRVARGAATSADAAALARALRAGLRAARLIWARTRDPRKRGPNEQMLRRDQRRLQAWRRNPGEGSAHWQLCYTVRNFAPAAQLVAVEQERADDSWETLQACHTIEFAARSARRRGGRTREHAAPVQWNGDPRNILRLRLVLRGHGQVRVAAIELTNGKARWRADPPRNLLGRPAPQHGWPALDWEKNQDQLILNFRRGRKDR
jgi:hypothetical protein